MFNHAPLWYLSGPLDAALSATRRWADSLATQCEELGDDASQMAALWASPPRQAAHQAAHLEHQGACVSSDARRLCVWPVLAWQLYFDVLYARRAPPGLAPSLALGAERGELGGMRRRRSSSLRGESDTRAPSTLEEP